ncbi:MAG: ABC transporter ATP-binding protein, partial [Flavobacteriaceae bacterium]
MNQTPILSVKDLSITFNSDGKDNEVIKGISFDLHENEILGVVGESGSGKSVSTMAILGLLPKQIAKITSGSVLFQEQDLTYLSEKQLENIRGKRISMIFQEPMSSLNPSMTCGKQVSEILQEHTSLSSTQVKNETLSLFEKVKLPDPNRVYSSYPHEISGGQMQRVMIAMAIACKPKILIADEPTTALDVTVQNEIITLLKELQVETKMSIIFITHDLSLVSGIADRILVMSDGKIVEQGSTEQIFRSPKHIYTQALIKSRPPLKGRLKKLPTVSDFLNKTSSKEIITDAERKGRHKKLYAQEALLEVVNLEKEYFTKSGWFSSPNSFKAVNQVSFKIYEGETLGLVGESGCGKSTLGNAILQLDRSTAGIILYRGKDVTSLKGKELRALRKEIQIIFQDPYASLNPRISIGNAILEPMKVHKLYGNDKKRKSQVIELLNRVGLQPEHYDRYPHEFSGGQRQRIGIARTIALNP